MSDDEHKRHVEAMAQYATPEMIRWLYGIPPGPEGDALLRQHLTAHAEQWAARKAKEK